MIMHDRQGKQAMQASSINYNYSKVAAFWAVGLRLRCPIPANGASSGRLAALLV